MTNYSTNSELFDIYILILKRLEECYFTHKSNHTDLPLSYF
jgi:hypothetical protein